MKKIMILCVVLNLLIARINASSFFTPDSDTVLLIELLTTTIEQLNELEQLVTESERLTGKIQYYNEVAIDHWYRAQRLVYLVEEITSLKDSKIENLGQLNSLIRQLKYDIYELKEIMIEYGVMEIENKKMIKNAIKDDLQIAKDNKLADLQIDRSHKVKTPANMQKVNMQTNAYANKNLVGIKNKNNQIVKLIAEQNKMIAKEGKLRSKKEQDRINYYGLWQDDEKKKKRSKRKPSKSKKISN